VVFFAKWFLDGDSWPLWLSRVLFWLPQNLEFATFSLLVLFFAQIVYLQVRIPFPPSSLPAYV